MGFVHTHPHPNLPPEEGGDFLAARKMADIKTVGVVGAGRMGLPIIGHLAKKGFDVRVNDIDAGKRGEAEKRGGKWSADAATLARECDAILVCVGYDREL